MVCTGAEAMSEPMNDMSLMDGQPEPVVMLAALPSYWEASEERRREVCNGAGPRWLDRFLPWWLRWLRVFADRLWALDCREAFDIHDWDYVFLEPTLDGKEEADSRLDTNLEMLVCALTRPGWLRDLRLREARRYVWLVREYGYKAFFDRD